MTNIMKIIGALTAISAFLICAFAFDSVYVKASVFDKHETKYELGLLEEDYISTRNRIWALEKQYLAPRPQVIQYEIDMLKKDLRAIDEKKKLLRSK